MSDKDVTEADLCEIELGESTDMIRTPDRISTLAYYMAREIRRRRFGFSAAERDALHWAIDVLDDTLKPIREDNRPHEHKEIERGDRAIAVLRRLAEAK